MNAASFSGAVRLRGGEGPLQVLEGGKGGVPFSRGRDDLLALPVVLRLALESSSTSLRRALICWARKSWAFSLVSILRLHPEIDVGLGDAVRDPRGEPWGVRYEGDRDEVAVLDRLDLQPREDGLDEGATRGRVARPRVCSLPASGGA